MRERGPRGEWARTAIASLVAVGVACGDDAASLKGADGGGTRVEAGAMDSGRGPSGAGGAEAVGGGASGNNSPFVPLGCDRPWELFPASEHEPCNLCWEASCCERLNQCGEALGIYGRREGCLGRLGCAAQCLGGDAGLPWWEAEVSGQRIAACLHGCGGERGGMNLPADL